VEARPRDLQHFAQPADGPDMAMLGDEGEPHVASRAKKAAVGSTGQRNIFDLRCSERTQNGTNRSPWLVVRAEV
jgi:hypothetical protein